MRSQYTRTLPLAAPFSLVADLPSSNACRESYRGPLLVAVQAPGGYERLMTSLPMLAEFPCASLCVPITLHVASFFKSSHCCSNGIDSAYIIMGTPQRLAEPTRTSDLVTGALTFPRMQSIPSCRRSDGSSARHARQRLGSPLLPHGSGWVCFLHRTLCQLPSTALTEPQSRPPCGQLGAFRFGGTALLSSEAPIEPRLSANCRSHRPFAGTHPAPPCNTLYKAACLLAGVPARTLLLSGILQHLTPLGPSQS